MFIPLRTDAPVYHRPWATISIIVINVLLQIWAQATQYLYVEEWIVSYGTITPVQWITSAFLHAGWLHCIGNMVFLWVFGLIVEGKIGWQRFLAIYFAIAVFAGAFEQVIMLWGEGGSLGGSA
jgi:membrane associated rhomboid family serine protease